MKYIALCLLIIVSVSSCNKSNSGALTEAGNPGANNAFKEYEDILSKQLQFHDRYLIALRNIESYEDFEAVTKKFNAEMKTLNERMIAVQQEFNKRGAIDAVPPRIEKLMKRIEAQQKDYDAAMKELEPKLSAIMAKRQGEHAAEPDDHGDENTVLEY